MKLLRNNKEGVPIVALKVTNPGVPVMAQWLTNPTRNHEVAGSVPGLAQFRRCLEMWCRLQMQLRSRVAVPLVLASGYSSDSTPSLGTSICRGSGPRKGKKDIKGGAS